MTTRRWLGVTAVFLLGCGDGDTLNRQRGGRLTVFRTDSNRPFHPATPRARSSDGGRAGLSTSAGAGDPMPAVAGRTSATTGGTTGRIEDGGSVRSTPGGGARSAGIGAGGLAVGGQSTVLALPPPNLLMAFLGDQGLGTAAEQVLQLIKTEGAAAVVHLGDFDCVGSPSRWSDQIDRILGPDYPYFAVVGNNDGGAWEGQQGYARYLAERQARIPDMDCTGEPGVKAACRFRGVGLVLSCIGTSELAGHGDCSTNSGEQTTFIQSALANEASPWKICAWHKTRADFQVGYKSDEVGMAAYEACFSQGAIVANAHEHSYARTFVLSELANRSAEYGRVGPRDRLEIGPGRSFVAVSGLGGHSIRPYNSSHDTDAWVAAYYTSTSWLNDGLVRQTSGQYGALFIRFHVMGNPRQAWGYFKTIDGRVVDEFSIVLND